MVGTQSLPRNEQVLETPASSPHTLYIRATVKGLASPILPFAILKSDPIADVREYLRQQRLADASHIHTKTISDAWHRLFAALRPEQNFFLCAWSSMPHASPLVVRMAGLYFTVATPGPHYQRWFTTHPVWWKGELVAWCEVIDMHDVRPGQATPIILSEERMLRFIPEVFLSSYGYAICS